MKKKKWLWMLVSVALVCAMIPMTALAVGETCDGTSCTHQAAVEDMHYATLADAFAEAASGSTIKMLDDVDISASIVEVQGKNLTLDLNGKAVSVKEMKALSGAKLTIVDSTATSKPAVNGSYQVSYASGVLNCKHAVSASEGGAVVMESGKINSSYLGLCANAGSTVTMKGGYVIAQEFAITAQGNGATASMNGGVAEARDNAVIAGNGSAGLGGTTINVTGGTMIGHITTPGYTSCGIYHPQEGTLNISGGTIYSEKGCGILMRAGKANITGGTIIADGAEDLVGKVGDSRVVVPTSGIIFDRDAGYPAVATTDIDVSGATVTGSKEAITVINTNNAEDVAGKTSVTSGTFSSDVKEFVGDGKASVGITSGENSTYYVGTPEAVAAEVAGAVEAGDTITVTKGNVALAGLPDGVTVSNEGSGNVTVNGNEVTDDPIITHTHVWGEPTWTWNADNSEATATFVCADNETHKEVKTATAAVQTTPATCAEAGKTVYTARIEFNGKSYTDTKTVDIPATGKHSFKDGKCTVCGVADPSVQPDEDPEPTDKPTTDVPKTGEDNSIMLWGMVLLVAGAGIAGVILYGRKKASKR